MVGTSARDALAGAGNPHARARWRSELMFHALGRRRRPRGVHGDRSGTRRTIFADGRIALATLLAGGEGRACSRRCRYSRKCSSPEGIVRRVAARGRLGRVSRSARGRTSKHAAGLRAVGDDVPISGSPPREPPSRCEGVVVEKGLHDELSGEMFVAIQMLTAKGYLRWDARGGGAAAGARQGPLGFEVEAWSKPADRIVARSPKKMAESTIRFVRVSLWRRRIGAAAVRRHARCRALRGPLLPGYDPTPQGGTRRLLERNRWKRFRELTVVGARGFEHSDLVGTEPNALPGCATPRRRDGLLCQESLGSQRNR